MRILALSDIHGRFDAFAPASLPDADVCVIAGDITNLGLHDTREFLQSEQWMAALVDRYPVTLWIPGNHDLKMKPDVYHPIGEYHPTGEDGPNSSSASQHRLHSILDRRFDFREFSFYGVSMSPAYDKPELASEWEHMTTRREVEEAAYALIPPDTDIVVSHCPPLLMRDSVGIVQNPDGSWQPRSIGSFALRRYIERHQPKLVVCGHVHESAGHLRYGQTEVHNVAEQWRLLDV